MKKELFIFILFLVSLVSLIFVNGCIDNSGFQEQNEQETGQENETNVSNGISNESNNSEAEALGSEEDLEDEIPLSYQIDNVPYYGEIDFCYGSSAMMLLKYHEFAEQEVQNYRDVVKTGPGGPPDMFMGFEDYGLNNEVKIAYSQNYNTEFADFYNELLNSPEEQVLLFNSKEEALTKLKDLIYNDIPVIVIIHSGNHYAVATGYDENYIYTNDPGFDTGYNYKIDSDPDLEQRRLIISDFLNEWTVEDFEGGGIGFPGDYGMIWFE